MDRRAFLVTSTVGATAAATLQLAGAAVVPPPGETGDPLPVRSGEQLPLGPLPGSRYPDPHIEAIDAKRFKGSPGTGAVERVATGFRWAEGPAYLRAGRYLIFSDIPNNRQMRLLEDDNHLSVFRSPSYNSNGNTVDRQGRLITCQHGGRRVVRTEFDGTHHRHRRQLQRQEAQLAERCGRGFRRFDLVYRSDPTASAATTRGCRRSRSRRRITSIASTPYAAR